MKTAIRQIALLSSLLLPGAMAYGVPCDGVTTCERPDSNATTKSGWSVSASGVSGVKALVSVGPTGNQVGSQYYFGASSSNLGSTIANGGFTPGGAGARVISTAFATNASQTPSAQVSGGSVQQILGNTAYYVYAQACPNGSGIYNSAGCSAWSLIGNTTTSSYPTSVFGAVQAPADATVNTIIVRGAVPSGDAGNISLLRVDIRDLLNSANNQTLAPISWSGNTTYAIDNTMYTQNGGFKPNVKYEYRGQVTYPFAVNVPTAGQQTRGPFWTTPVNPGPMALVTKTHCSAQISAQNSGGLPANPTYTSYRVCTVGTGGSCAAPVQIGGSGNPADSKTFSFNSLTPGTAYTSNGQALVGNGDSSSSGWSSSGLTSGPSFTTDSWGGTFSVSGVTTTGATFNATGIIGAASISSWQILLNGSATGQPNGSGAPPAAIALSGLTPNTSYTVQIQLTETSGCSTILPTTAIAFTTTPTVPTPNTFTAPAPRSLSLSWGANGNPGGTTYEITYSVSSTFATSPVTVTTTNTSLTINDGGSTPVSPETTYYVRVRARNVLRPTWPDSAFANFAAPATTPNEAPTVQNPVCTLNGPQTQASCTVSASDNGGATQLKYDWSISPSAGTTITPNGQINNNATTITIPGSGTYIVSVTVTDHSDVGGLSVTKQTTINPGQSVNWIELSPGAPTVGRGQSVTVSATVYDFNNAVIPSQAVDWTLLGGGGTVSPANGASTLFTAGNTLGIFNLKAETGGASATAPVTVAANTVVVTAAQGVVGTGDSTSVTATVTTPQSQTITPTITWTVSGCPAGNDVSPASGSPATFNALGQGGTCLITATDQYGDTGSVSVVVDPTVPRFSQAPSAIVHITSATLTTLGEGFNPESAFTYTWSVVSGVSVDFAPNGTNAAKNAVAIFSQAGTYTLQAMVTDTVNGLSATQTLQVVVDPVLTGITVSPNGITVKTFANQTFTAAGIDQFGGSMSAGNVTWSTTGGNISGAGVFNSPSLGSNITVRARNGNVVGQATVNAISYDVSGAYGYPVPFKSTRDSVITFRDLGSSAKIRIYTPTGRLVFNAEVASPTFDWNVINNHGERLASGVYFYVIESPEAKKDGKLVIIQ